jgi:hypothetical protein
MDLQGRGVYRQHRIHTTRLFSGVWVVAIVRLGAGPARGHAGPPVEHLRGEHPSEAEAIAAARGYIDQLRVPACEPTDQDSTRGPRPAPVPKAIGDLFAQKPRGAVGV